MNATETHDPSKSLPGWEYVPYHDDPAQELARLERCLQQQVEDCFTTISRIEKLADDAGQSQRWKTLRAGLRCWRLAIGASTPSR